MKNLTNAEKTLIIDALRSHKAGLEHMKSLNSVMVPGKPEEEARFEQSMNKAISEVEVLAEKIISEPNIDFGADILQSCGRCMLIDGIAQAEVIYGSDTVEAVLNSCNRDEYLEY